MTPSFDVIVIGGSYSGLSAAMALGRSLRKVLVVDSGKPCNAQTPHSHNFLTQDGIAPGVIANIGRQQVAAYKTVEFTNDLATKATKTANGFSVELASGNVVTSRRLVLATGIKDQLPNIPGFADCWGISVVHCPYCHGYEYRHRKTAMLANGETAIHYGMLLTNLTKDLTLLTNGKADFTPEQLDKFKKHNITIYEAPVLEIQHNGGHLTGVVLSNDKLAFDAVYFRPPFTQHTDIAQTLGCELTEQGHLKVDAMQKTSVEGVFACGDNCGMMRSVANSVSTGNIAGAAINRELAMEEF